jgi:hypothetical protein
VRQKDQSSKEEFPSFIYFFRPVLTRNALRKRLRVFRVPAGKPEDGFAAVKALNRYESGETPDIFYVTLNVEARKNEHMVVRCSFEVKLRLPALGARD